LLRIKSRLGRSHDPKIFQKHKVRTDMYCPNVLVY